MLSLQNAKLEMAQAFQSGLHSAELARICDLLQEAIRELEHEPKHKADIQAIVDRFQPLTQQAGTTFPLRTLQKKCDIAGANRTLGEIIHALRYPY